MATLKNTKKANLNINGLIVACGNTKSPITTAIINMSSAKECPSQFAGFCPFAPHSGSKYAGKCYALKAERMYKNTRNVRRKQTIYWRDSDWGKIVIDVLELIERRSRTKYPLRAIRFNEAGDMDTIDCLEKLIRVAEYVDIPVYAYTHNCFVMRDVHPADLPRNLTINLSYWDENKYKQGFNIFCLPEDIPSGIKTKRCAGACHLGCTMCQRETGAITVDLH
jgi:hypothetical protein